MLEQPVYALPDPLRQRAVVDRHPWAMLVTALPSAAPVISHLPVLLESADHLTVRSHLPREDADLHQLGDHDVVLVLQGPHGYISPSFYRAAPYVPTWNFAVVHLHGRPQLLDGPTTFAVLEATVDRFESERARPWALSQVADFAADLAVHTVGFRLEPTRVVGKAKMSQDKAPEIVQRVLTALEEDPDHRNPPLAAYMREVHEESRP